MQTRIDQRFRSQRARGFKFEEAWLLWEDYERWVDEALTTRGGSGLALSIVHEKIAYCGADLQVWGAIKTHSDVEKIKLQKQVEYLNMRETTEKAGLNFWRLVSS